MAFFRSGPLSPLVLLATAVLVCYQIAVSNGAIYRASALEFTPTSPKQGAILNRKEAVDLMTKNILVYRKQAKRAGQNMNDIIVFPEYGLFGIFGYKKYARRTDIYPFLEAIPDPRKKSWNPCNDRYSSYPSTEIQKELSCMAKDFDIYVVANVGEKVPCKKRDDSNCPSDGRYQYNTNVVYSSNGTLVAKYRKKHLFKEDYYNSPAKTEVVTFSTHFGKFGLMTSYDSLFKSPLIDLVRDRHMSNIVMPNAWVTSKPLFRTIQWHSAITRSLGINLLVATVHDGHCGSYGSAFYTPSGAKYIKFQPDNPEPQFVTGGVKNVVRKDKKRPAALPRYTRRNRKIQNFSMAVFNDEVTFKFVEFFSQRDIITVCHGRFCCRLNYTASDRIEKYGLGVYKGYVRTLGYLLAVEMCVVVRCFPKCGQPILRANTYFDTFTLTGINFSTEYVYPQLLAMDGQEVMLDDHEWEFHQDRIIAEDPLNYPLHSASLMGRVYKQDQKDHRSPYTDENGRPPSYDNHAHTGHCLSVFITIVAFIASLMFSS